MTPERLFFRRTRRNQMPAWCTPKVYRVVVALAERMSMAGISIPALRFAQPDRSALQLALASKAIRRTGKLRVAFTLSERAEPDDHRQGAGPHDRQDDAHRRRRRQVGVHPQAEAQFPAPGPDADDHRPGPATPAGNITTRHVTAKVK
jgi:hypothetical protein